MKIEHMQSPKLKRAMLAIREILIEENLAGIVVIHTPGYVDSLVRIDPAYSCCRIKNGAYKLNVSLYDDFGGDKEAMKERVQDTSDMLNALVVTAAQLTLPLGDITRNLNRATDSDNPVTNN